MSDSAPDVDVGDRVTVQTDGVEREGIVTSTYSDSDDMIAAAVKEAAESNDNPPEEWEDAHYQASYQVETSLGYGSGDHSWREGWD